MLEGVVVPLVTPMSEPGIPSAAAAEPLLAAMASAGIERLMLLGSNGEGPLIPYDLAGEYVAGVVKQWRELVPGGVIMVNVTAAGTQESGRRAADAAAAGADALVSSPPTFFRHRDDEVIAHFAALGTYGLPVAAYNTPRSTPLNRAIVDALVAMPHLIGVKDSSGDPSTVASLLAAPGLQVSQGDEQHLADALRAGAHGITPGIANLAPRLALELAADPTDHLQHLATALTAIHKIRPGVPTVKALLHTRGLCPPHSSPPLTPCTPAELNNLLQTVEPLEPYLIRQVGTGCGGR
ncbi:dihydrodipicolinate synthase family protein [Kribbella sindirgiensis]|uniref:Dihydrodipicolinate synthase family protein n=1 Tax=Kribbella sindirgiensis TaxID=1124744 RepID=A0A4R0IQ08_9ACTN|nr:dihydrodipicolinate synthase family protein [Kribbella sindirgiensis]TCC34640.1 dihydrodipicolinate synthase family protein [Kribbella sindirgiensis]